MGVRVDRGLVAGFVLMLGAAATGCPSVNGLTGAGPGQDAGADVASPIDAGADACSPDTQTDAKNCGRCGHDCLGGACAAGACQPFTLAKAAASHPSIAVDDAGVYFFEAVGTTGRLLTCPLTGCTGPAAEVVKLADGEVGTNLLVQGGVIYFATFTWSTNTERLVSIRRGQSATQLHARASAPLPSRLLLVGSDLYWVSNDNSAGTSTVRTCPTKGCSAGSTVVTSLPSYVPAIAIYGGDLYVQRGVDGVTLKCALPACPTLTPLGAFSFGELERMFVDTDGITFGVSYANGGVDHGALARAPLAGWNGDPRVLVDVSASMGNFEVDGADIYFTMVGDPPDHKNGGIARVKRDGSGLTTVAASQWWPGWISAYGPAIYWVNGGSGDVVRLAK